MVEVIINTLKWVIIFFLILVAIILIGSLITNKKELKKGINKGVETVEQGVQKVEQNIDNDVTVNQNKETSNKSQEIVENTTVNAPDTGVTDYLWILGLLTMIGGFLYVKKYQN